MITKELIDARWKILPGLLIPLMLLLVFVVTTPGDIDPTRMRALLHGPLSAATSKPVPLYDVWIWDQAFFGGYLLFFAVLASVLGAGMIAGEASRGTIFFLLSRPVSRDRVLLLKYAVAAALLLGIAALMGLETLVIPALHGYPQHIGGVLFSTLLLWLEELFVLGVALVYSIVFRDVLRPVLLALLTTGIIIALPGYIVFLSQLPERLQGKILVIGRAEEMWQLPTYWSSLDAFAGNGFPVKALLISLVAAAIPLILALLLFRRRAY